jgi:hypothetical protein
MAARRFVSGDLTIKIKYSDRGGPNGTYTARVCARRERACETVKVHAPAYLSHAVDSPRAFHDAAHAAISFSRLSEYAQGNPRGTGWSLRRPRRR